ncbi:MAG: hypothetical protein C0602_00495 [Denitrovibrio sp.]|nr:MAG: hypothetical protein C0602_00495 [Denitrovibrio sp.]
MQLLMSAVCVSEKMRTKGIELGQRTSYLPSSFNLGENQWVVIFRFGVVVTIGINDKERSDILSEITPFMDSPLSSQLSENIHITIGGKEDIIDNEQIRLKSLSREHVLVMADIMAKSVMLDRYETAMSEVFTEIEPLARQLMKGRSQKIKSKELTHRIGATLLIQQIMVGRVEVHEKPETLWDHPELEKFFHKLEDEFEIAERNSALQKKLELITNTAETQLELINRTHSLRVEWYIVILIVVEIVLTLYEMFLRH